MECERQKVVFLHTPKTGGAALADFLRRQFGGIRRNYFLSFSGNDDSTFFDDELCTRRPGGNRCVIERIFAEPAVVNEFKDSPHFQQSRVLFGHATCALGELFPEYEFQYLTVLREPIERTVSNIAQFSGVMNGQVKFGSYWTEQEKYSSGYWDFIYEILTTSYPVDGLQVHENCYLRDCMTRVLQGSKYLDVHEEPDLDAALRNAERIKISFFQAFNDGIRRSFGSFGIAVDMSRNQVARSGEPQNSEKKKLHGKYYGASRRIIDFVVEHNQTDVKLYNMLKAKSGN